MDIVNPRVPNLLRRPAKSSGQSSAKDAKATRRRNRSLIVLGNLFLLVGVVAFLVVNRSTSQTARNSLSSSPVSAANNTSAPLDQISSAEIALQTALQTHLPEITAIRNAADSESLLLNTVPNDSAVLSSPQIISTAEKSRYQIIRYRVKPGDSVPSIASKFHITTTSVTGSNNLASDFVSVGTWLYIPPANGLVYTVQSGDTVASIVSTYGANRSLFVTVNDAEHGVFAGEHVFIPNVGGPQAQTTALASLDTTFAFGSSPIYGYNGYDFGTCTWYVASQINVPSNWGNAYTWGPGAEASGWTVSSSPHVGAIAWADSSKGFGYLGHVAIVSAVSADGSQIKYKDMNDPYWDVVANHDWASSSIYSGYISH